MSVKLQTPVENTSKLLRVQQRYLNVVPIYDDSYYATSWPKSLNSFSRKGNILITETDNQSKEAATTSQIP